MGRGEAEVTDDPEEPAATVRRSHTQLVDAARRAGALVPSTGDSPTLLSRDGVHVGAFGRDPSWDGHLARQATPQLGAGALFAGRYRVTGRLAHGGMGAVWSARDETLQRDVAIKLMGAEGCDDPDLRARFLQEARAASALASPHVVAIFDLGTEDGVPFMVLELLVGEDLGQLLARVGRLSPASCDDLLAQVAEGLTAAHAIGLVHRDLKPSNIFLARRPGGGSPGTAKLLDFGVAKRRVDPELRTRTGIVLGTPQFMSPEQVRGARDIDHRSDLFSLGSVLYRCLTGRRPFDASPPTTAMVQIELGSFTPPSQLVAGLPRGVDAFFATALARDPARRFPSAAAMSEAFRTIVRGEAGPSATPPRRARVARGEAASVIGRVVSRLPARSDDEVTVALHDQQAAGFVDLGRVPPPGSPWARPSPPPEDGRARPPRLASVLPALALALAAVAAAVFLATS